MFGAISGDSGTLYESVHNQIFSLPPEFNLYPAHDYTGKQLTMGTVGIYVLYIHFKIMLWGCTILHYSIFGICDKELAM